MMLFAGIVCIACAAIPPPDKWRWARWADLALAIIGGVGLGQSL